MLYAFIDESYTKDRYYVAAFVIPEEQISAVAGAMRAARDFAETFGVLEPEFHAYEMMSGGKAWKPIRGKHRAAIAIYRKALAELVEIPGARMFIEGVDIPLLNARYRYPDPPHRVTLRYLLEAIDRYAAPRKERVVIIADEVPDQVAHGQRMADYQLIGTGGFRSSMLKTLEMPIHFGSSAKSPGLQAADLIVYLYRRLDAHAEKDDRARRSVEAMWAMLRPIWEHVRRWDP